MTKKIARTYCWLPAALTLFTGACGGSGSAPSPQPPVVAPPTPFVPGTTFTEISTTSGVDHSYVLAAGTPSTHPAFMGGGLAAVDIDADDDIDLYLVAGDNNANAMFRNNGGNQFTRIESLIGLDAMHLGSGPAFADIDGDFDLDVFVGGLQGQSFLPA